MNEKEDQLQIQTEFPADQDEEIQTPLRSIDHGIAPSSSRRRPSSARQGGASSQNTFKQLQKNKENANFKFLDEPSVVISPFKTNEDEIEASNEMLDHFSKI